MTTPDQPYATTPKIPAQAALEFLCDVRRLVAFHQAIGIEGYPRTPELAQFLAGPQPPAAAARHPPAPAAKPKTAQTPPSSPPVATMPDATLTELFAEIRRCRSCPRHQTRTKAITGTGVTGARLMIITDFPSAEDDQTGLPMSGEPGLLLDKMLGAIGLSRAEVHLSLLARCHAPEPPGQETVDECLPYLLKEITLVAPRVICAMGPLAARKLLHTDKPLSRLRGAFHDFQGIPLMSTFSPEFLLKNPEMKKAAWEDLKMIQKKCDGK